MGVFLTISFIKMTIRPYKHLHETLNLTTSSLYLLDLTLVDLTENPPFYAKTTLYTKER